MEEGGPWGSLLPALSGPQKRPRGPGSWEIRGDPGAPSLSPVPRRGRPSAAGRSWPSAPRALPTRSPVRGPREPLLSVCAAGRAVGVVVEAVVGVLRAVEHPRTVRTRSAWLPPGSGLVCAHGQQRCSAGALRRSRGPRLLGSPPGTTPFFGVQSRRGEPRPGSEAERRERALSDPLPRQRRGGLGGPMGGMRTAASLSAIALPPLRPRVRSSQCQRMSPELLRPIPWAPGDGGSSSTGTLRVHPPLPGACRPPHQPQSCSARAVVQVGKAPAGVSLPGSEPVRPMRASPSCVCPPPTSVSYCPEGACSRDPRRAQPAAGSALYPAPMCLGSHATNRCPSLVPTPRTGVCREGRGAGHEVGSQVEPHAGFASP